MDAADLHMRWSRIANDLKRIWENVYATDAINPNGATMVTARLTRNFGRPDQRTETMELELKPDETGEKLVGRFNVGARNDLSQR